MSRLRRLDRRSLENEARRVGIADPATLGREELVQRIARERERAEPRRPRSLLGRAVAFAFRTLDEAASRLSPPAPPRAPSPRAPAPSASRTEVLGPAAPPGPLPAAPLASPVPSSAPSPTPTPAPTVARAVEAPSATPPARADAARGEASSSWSPPPADVPRDEAPSATLATPADVPRHEAAGFDEPLPTRTMARLLRAQGHYRRALAIYDGLERAHPHDRALIAEAAEVRSEARAARASRGEPPAPAEEDAEEDGAEVVLLQADAGTALMAWGVGDAAVARARRALGSDGVLVARLVVVRPDADHVVRTELHEREVGASGQATLGALPLGAEVTAAVGVRAGERFVSVAHAPPRAIV